jgi:tetratricopeptide (TPR) repeat protein
VAYFEQALGALQHFPACRDTVEQAIDLRFDLHNALLLIEGTERIVDHLHEVKTLAQSLCDQWRLARVAFYLSAYLRQMGDQTRALASAQRALALAAALGEFGLQEARNFRQGQVYFALGDYRQALYLSRKTSSRSAVS